MRVNFLIAGTQKGGTTALAHFLRQHPEICLAQKKEIHFFNNDEFFSSGQESPDYEVYHREFPNPGRSIAIGEATPIYMYWKAAPARIFAYNPSMKLIFLLRNPIERAYSHFVMEKTRNRENLPFSIAIRSEPFRLASGKLLHLRHHSYLDRGRYAHQIRNMLRFFPRTQMLILKSEDLRQHHVKVLDQVFDFLGVDPRFEVKGEVIFSQKYDRLTQPDSQFLYHYFEREIDALEELLGWDLSSWRIPPGPDQSSTT